MLFLGLLLRDRLRLRLRVRRLLLLREPEREREREREACLFEEVLSDGDGAASVVGDATAAATASGAELMGALDSIEDDCDGAVAVAVDCCAAANDWSMNVAGWFHVTSPVAAFQ